MAAMSAKEKKLILAMVQQAKESLDAVEEAFTSGENDAWIRDRVENMLKMAKGEVKRAQKLAFAVALLAGDYGE